MKILCVIISSEKNWWLELVVTTGGYFMYGKFSLVPITVYTCISLVG